MKVRAKQQARTTVHYDMQIANKQPSRKDNSPYDQRSHIEWLEDQPLSEDPRVSPQRYWRKKIFQNKARSEVPVSTNIPQSSIDVRTKSPNPQFVLDDLGENFSQPQNPTYNGQVDLRQNNPMNLLNQMNLNQFHQSQRQYNYQSQPNFVDNQRIQKIEESFHRNKRMTNEQHNQTDRRISQIQQQIKLLSEQFSEKVQGDKEFQSNMISIIKRKDQALLGKQHEVNHNLRHIMDLQENQRYYRNEIENLKNQIAHEKRISQLSKENQRLYQKILYARPQKINANSFDSRHKHHQFDIPAKDSYSLRDNSFAIQSPKRQNRKIQVTNLSPQKYQSGVQNITLHRSNLQIDKNCVLSPFSVDPTRH